MLLDQLVVGNELPRAFLAKLFRKLAQAGIVIGTRGRGGGFELARPEHQVTLRQIVEAMEGPWPLDGCAVGMTRFNRRKPCAQHHFYEPIREVLREYMDKTTLADLALGLNGMAGS